MENKNEREGAESTLFMKDKRDNSIREDRGSRRERISSSSYRESGSNERVRRSFNPNFNSENRVYGAKSSYNREDRPERPSFNRGERSERTPFNREDRGDRPSFNRGERSERSPFNRSDRGDRPSFNRSDRGERPSFNRSDRGERPSFNRDNRGDRPSFNRSDRGDRPSFNRGERSERPSFNREDRGDRPSFNRGDRPSFNRNDRGDRPSFNRGERPSFNRNDRGDRPSYNREDRGDRPSFNRNDRGERPSYNREDRGERAPRPSFNREYRTDSSSRRPAGGNRRPSNNNSFSRREKEENVPFFAEPLLTKEVRLNRYIAMSGVCSRRDADDIIARGEITVNGAVVTELGTKVGKTDVVCYNEKVIQGEKLVYVLMNKPKGAVTTLDDPHADMTILDLLEGKVEERVFPVGRLDKNSLGVILLTNDGDLAKDLTHPSLEKKKIYHVFLDKDVSESDMERIAEGVELEDGLIYADEVSYVKNNPKEVGIEIHSGRNRIVRRIFEHLGYKVLKLDRVYFAGLTKKGLKRGTWRYLNEKEVLALKGGRYN